MIGDLFDNPWAILVVAVLILVMFGSRKLPDAARSLGKSMRILKTEVRGLHEEDDEPAAAIVHPASAQVRASAAPAVPAAPAVDAQAQIDALSKQLADLQQSVAANKADNAQAS